MTLTVWKYPLAFGSQTILMPQNARILAVQTQHNEPQLWALVNPEAPDETRRFLTIGTGTEFEADRLLLDYIGTFQLHSGSLVFHLFECK